MSNKLAEKIKEMKSSLELPKKAKDALITAGIVLSGAGITGGAVAYKMSEDNKKQATEILQQAGVNSLEEIEARDIFDRTPLMAAKSAMETKVLLAYGADPKAEDKFGSNAIWHTLADRTDFVEEKKDVKLDGEIAYVTYEHKFSNGKNEVEFIGEVESQRDEVKGKEMGVGAGIEIKRSPYTHYVSLGTIKEVDKNTESAIKDQIERVALLLKAGCPLKLDGLELDDVQKRILTAAGKLSGKEKEVENAMKKAEKTLAKAHKGDILKPELGEAFKEVLSRKKGNSGK